MWIRIPDVDSGRVLVLGYHINVKEIEMKYIHRLLEVMLELKM